MEGWQGRMVVSAACESAPLSDAFLAAGATAVVAPTVRIPWVRLAGFFGAVYENLIDASRQLEEIVETEKSRYPELDSYEVYRPSVGQGV